MAGKPERALKKCRPPCGRRACPGRSSKRQWTECCDGDAAQEAIRELLRKRRYDPDTASPEETRKTLAYLMRKGFRYDDVRQVIQVSEWNA